MFVWFGFLFILQSVVVQCFMYYFDKCIFTWDMLLFYLLWAVVFIVEDIFNELQLKAGDASEVLFCFCVMYLLDNLILNFTTTINDRVTIINIFGIIGCALFGFGLLTNKIV